MRIRAMDSNGDMQFGRGQRNFYRDQAEGVAQNIRTRLSLWQGEWFLDVTEGMPWKTRVLGKGTAPYRDAAIRARVLGTTAVSEITSYSSTFNPETRTFSPAITVKTAYGTATITEPR